MFPCFTPFMFEGDKHEQTPNKQIETNNNMSNRRRSRLTLPAEYISEKPAFNRPKASTLQTKNLQQVRAVYGSNSLMNAVMAESGLSGNTTTTNNQNLEITARHLKSLMLHPDMM